MFGIFEIIWDVMKRRRAGQNILKRMDIKKGTHVGLGSIDGMFPLLAHVGKNCIFAPSVMILTHDASYYLHTGEYRIAPVHIGDNCFIGYGVIIMPGVNVGNNVVIGAGSVVTRDIPSDTVAAGVPARVICAISEYLDKRKQGQMFKAPYEGKIPSQISSEDIAGFRKGVYGNFGISESLIC